MSREIPSKLHQLAADKAAAALAEKVVRQRKRVEVAERAAEQAAKRLEVLGTISEGLDALDVWLRSKPAGRKPRVSRDDLAASAMRIADSEGFEALSMRRLAAELDVGTMTLYHYVKTKDELLTLLHDALAAELIVPPDEPLPTDWRDAIRVLARRSLAVLRRHPWVLDIKDDPSIGPNGVKHFDQSMQAVSSMPGTLEDRLDVVLSIDEFVFGYFLMERNNYADDGLGHLSGERLLEYVRGLVRTGGYPALGALLAEHDAELWGRVVRHARDTDRFERNLGRFVAGLAADLDGHTSPASPGTTKPARSPRRGV